LRSPRRVSAGRHAATTRTRDDTTIVSARSLRDVIDPMRRRRETNAVARNASRGARRCGLTPAQRRSTRSLP
jgi:hypothetical protein